MWHVDEGALHAYLDGALDEFPAAEARRVREHLETCRECSERLAEERGVREEAQDILALATPRVEVPSLEELRAYVKAQAPQRTGASMRLYRLSWAASVVLALGTGWLLRGGLPPTVAPAERAFTAGAAEEAVSGGVPGAPASELERSSEAGNELTASGGLTAGGASAASGGSAVVERQQAAPAAFSTVDSPADARAPGESRREVAERLDDLSTTRAPASEPVAGLAASSGDAATAKAVDDATAEPGLADTPRSAAEPAPAPAPAAPTVPPSAADRARQDPSTVDENVAQRSPEPRVTSTVRQAPAAAGFEVETRSLGRAAGADTPRSPDADGEAETTSLVIPGLEVLDVLPVGEGTTFAGMRALQRLPSGDTLETVHLPAGVDPRSLPPLRGGWSELVQARGSGWVVMRAPLPEASLDELLQRLESGR